jgi:hypothetical protein
VKGKKVEGKIVEGKKVNRKWDDFKVVWYEWKWKESERKEWCIYLVNDINNLSQKWDIYV